MAEDASGDGSWLDLDALAREDPMRAAALNHLESTEGISAEEVEEAAEQSVLQLVQTLYETSQSDDEGADPEAVLQRLGVNTATTAPNDPGGA